MRVVVIGASGNVGTAVLRALAREPVVTSMVGVARRVPRADGSSTTEFPHAAATWVRVDLTDTVDAVTRSLDEAVRGADVVVHLAWAAQPSHDRAALRRVNVDGSRRVLDAVVRNRVPHLMVVSSWGTYSPGPPDGRPVDESWPARGVPTSSYSVDKAAVERMRVTTRRGRAAAGMPGDVLGGLLRGWHAQGGGPVPDDGARLPLLPFPAGVRLQALHADDAAEAIRSVIVRRQPGAFNLAADDVLTGQDLADLLAGGRLLELPQGLVRRALAVAWRLRLAAVDEGWFDMGAALPVIDATRARSTLRWRPTRTTAEAVLEVVDAIIENAGATTPPLSAR